MERAGRIVRSSPESAATRPPRCRQLEEMEMMSMSTKRGLRLRLCVLWGPRRRCQLRPVQCPFGCEKRRRGDCCRRLSQPCLEGGRQRSTTVMARAGTPSRERGCR